MSDKIYYPNTLIVGFSGEGKSSSVKNLPAETTAVLIPELKPMPYIKPGEKAIMVKSEHVKDFCKTFEEKLNKAIVNPDIRYIVIDSLTAVYEEIHREAAFLESGFDVYSYFNNKLEYFLKKTKGIPNKQFYWISILDRNEEEDRYYAKVTGTKWRNAVEKEFVTVILCKTTTNEGAVKHQFITNKIPGFTQYPTKSIPGLLPEIMDNDLNEVRLKYEEAYGIPDSWTITEEAPKKEPKKENKKKSEAPTEEQSNETNP